MNTPKRLHSGSDDPSDFLNVRRRTRLSSNEDLQTPIDDQIDQVAKRHRVPTDTVKRIFSDLLTEPTVIDYLRTRINSRPDESTMYFENSSQNLLPNEQNPFWLEFLQSFNTNEVNQTNIPSNTTQTTITFDSLFSEEDDDEDFIGPDDEIPNENIDEKKLRVSRRELALLLKESDIPPEHQASNFDKDLFPIDQNESLYTDFVMSLQTGNENSNELVYDDQQQKSVITTTTEEDDQDDPEFRLPETDYELEDDLGEGLHVSKRELALLLEDNASILNPDEFINPESVSSTKSSSSTFVNTFEFHLTSQQRQIIQYQLSAYVQLLTQYILLQRETNPQSADCQSAYQLFNDLIYFRDKQVNSILDIRHLTESQRLIESSPPSNRRKALGNHLPFHLMDTFCKDPAFVHDCLLPTCLLTSTNPIPNIQTMRNFVPGEDCLMALGLEQNDQKMFIFGHNDKSIDDRLNSLRYARVRRGKQNPVKAFFTYGYVPDVSLQPWYQIPNHFDIKHIYRNGLLDKSNVTFPPWFRLSYKRSRQLTKNKVTTVPCPTNTSLVDPNDSLSSSTVYVVVEDSTSQSRPSTSPNKVLQQIHMLHLLNSYPKLQPKQN